MDNITGQVIQVDSGRCCGLVDPDAVHCLYRESGSADSAQCFCLDKDGHVDLVQRLCLAGLTLLPIPDVENITQIFQQAKSHRSRLLDGSSTQETLIYCDATTAHVDALAAYIDTIHAKAHTEYLDAVNSLDGDSDHPAALQATYNYHNALDRGDARYPGLITFFGDKTGLLFFKMTTPTDHAAYAHSLLSSEIMSWAGRIDLQLVHWSPTAIQRADRGEQKQANASVQPLLRRTGSFPTVVMEEGNNGMLLRMDKNWWFDNSPPDQPQGDVKIVVLVKMDRLAKSITIELWDRHHLQFPSQTVTITPHPEESLSTDRSSDDSRWVVEGAPLVIPLERVFLRPKQDGETDFVMAEPALVAMARVCWHA